ncbi:MAG: bifunctional demethylmenaquinone methyltransferase/2-methoxy-6-polyprenyl-1,4-benzoquinol methylase UbiE [Eubacteriales bacterium]|nr:bifunctional demethylmenaquinone methyltransferase/2-methoxy-6-polyprenyl-1,4-benzoquinol methylase UbiE [Eubacteriales bacterium]
MDKMEKAERVHGLFETIAGGYDQANERISLGMQRSWKKMLIKRIVKQAPAGVRILDVCCGTGDIALGIAKQRGDIQVCGLDFSASMLKIAKKKRNRMHLGRTLFFEGDAMNLPFEDDTFAAVTISFGLRNTADYMQVIEEMKRVVRPGGCVYCLDSFVPGIKWIQPFYRLYFQKMMPLIGGGRKYKQEYQWLSESTECFLKPEGLTEMFQTAGLTHIRMKKKMFGACVMVWGRK